MVPFMLSRGPAMRVVSFSETVRFLAPEGLVAGLREAAGRHGVTVSEYVRGAIRERLATDEVAVIQEPTSG